MRSSRLLHSCAALVIAPTLLLGANANASATNSAEYTVTTLHFKVGVGPTGSEQCDVIGDLYTPAEATGTHRVPAILVTNGFGGSKNDQAGAGESFASRGYVVLSYSGLGFGGSGCKITLDDPDYDGQAASQLISYLGGRTGIAFLDAQHTVAANKLDVVELDSKDHASKRVANDPRVGMFGLSYAGAVQYATAAVDPRLDTIVPIATWNDLSYSLAPNNTSQTTGVSTSTPGAAKLVWALGFTGLGVVNGLQNTQDDPARLLGCPNFATFVCPTLATAAVTGSINANQTKHLRHASVANYIKKVNIPTLVMQGQSDTLFNLNEGIATYRALKRQGTTTKMVWINGGHSGPSAPGEADTFITNPAKEYITKRVSDWFDHYLRGNNADTGPGFSYFRDWVKYTGIATPAYAEARSYPVGKTAKYYLSGTGLTTSATTITAGSQSFVTPPAGIPTSTDLVDVVGSALPLPEEDLPGTFASWSTPALTKALDVVGQPRLTAKVSARIADTPQSIGANGSLVLFVKIADVDSAGTATIVRNLVAPVRVLDPSKPFTVTMPAFVHRFAKGHSIRLVVAGGSTNYRGGLIPETVSVATGTTEQVLVLPSVS